MNLAEQAEALLRDLRNTSTTDLTRQLSELAEGVVYHHDHANIEEARNLSMSITIIGKILVERFEN